jgi:hypothetical protein
MTFTVLVTIWSGQQFGWNSATFFLIAIISYVFKDRFKDWGKALGRKLLRPYIADKRTVLSTPLKEKTIGSISEMLSYPTQDEIGAEILEKSVLLKEEDLTQHFDAETILHYTRSLYLKEVEILRTHKTLPNIVSILRFDFQRFLGQMDDPFRRINFIDTENVDVDYVLIPRVYHIPLIISYQNLNETDQPPSIQAVRIVLNRKGIQRIENLDQITKLGPKTLDTGIYAPPKKGGV